MMLVDPVSKMISISRTSPSGTPVPTRCCGWKRTWATEASTRAISSSDSSKELRTVRPFFERARCAVPPCQMVSVNAQHRVLGQSRLWPWSDALIHGVPRGVGAWHATTNEQTPTKSIDAVRTRFAV